MIKLADSVESNESDVVCRQLLQSLCTRQRAHLITLQETRSTAMPERTRDWIRKLPLTCKDHEAFKHHFDDTDSPDSAPKGTLRLLPDIEAWVEIYKIENVRGEDVGKFRWLGQ